MPKKTKMTNSVPTISEAVTYRWEQTKKQFLPFWGFMLIAMVANSIGKSIGHNMVAQIISFAVSMVVGLGMSKMLARLGRGEKVDFADYWNYFGRIVDFIVVSILLSLMVVFGFIFLIVPGVYLAIKYGFAPTLVVDKNMSFTEALSGSAEMTKGNMMSLLGLWIAMIGVVILGALAFGVGLLLAIPIVTIGHGYVYNRLVARAK